MLCCKYNVLPAEILILTPYLFYSFTAFSRTLQLFKNGTFCFHGSGEIGRNYFVAQRHALKRLI